MHMFFTITKLRTHKTSTNVSGLKKIIEVTSMNFTGYKYKATTIEWNKQNSWMKSEFIKFSQSGVDYCNMHWVKENMKEKKL